jgi:peptidyl-prolyl cis-trans isomerase D
MRDKMQGVFAWVVIIILVLVFLLWGVSYYVSSAQVDRQTTVATVNKDKIPQNDYHRVYQRAYQQQAAAHSGNANLIDTKLLKKQVIDSLVQQLVLVQNARELGMSVPNELIDQIITHQQYFQQGGVFSEGRMKEALQQMGMDVSQLRKQFKRDILINQVKLGLVDSDFILSNELSEFKKQQDQVREFRYFTINANNLKVKDPTSKQIKAYYLAHPEDFKTKPEVKVSYILLSFDAINKKLASSIKDNDEGLLQYYTDNMHDKKKKLSKVDLAKLKNNLKKEYIESLAQKQYEKKGNDLQQFTFENPDSLSEASMSLNLPIKQTQFFSQDMIDESYKGILKSLAVRKMAFSDEVLQQKLNSDIINLPGKKVLVMHFAGFHPIKLLDIKKVSNKIKQILISDAKFKLAKDLADKIKSGTPAQASLIMKKYNWSLGDLKSADQQNTKIPQDLLLAVFNTPITAGLSTSKQPLDFVALSTGKIAVFKLQKIAISSDKKGNKGKYSSKNTLVSLYSNMLYSAYLNELLESSNISYGNKK